MTLRQPSDMLPQWKRGWWNALSCYPSVRDSDRSTHPPIVWRLLQDAIRAAFPQGHSGPELMYRDIETVPGSYVEGVTKRIVRDES